MLLRSALALAALGGAACPPCRAEAMRFCDRPADPSAAQQDRLFRFAAIIKHELEASGQRVALISRSGLDLARFGVRYSHAGLSLKSSGNTPWSVRQLYYACDEGRPRLFDQGLLGFLLGLNDPATGYVSVVVLPPAEADALEQTVLDKRRALRALAATYSANAYAFGLRYQNCNQWVAEVLAAAWGRLDEGGGDSDDGAAGDDLRAQAQRWLRERGYTPSEFDVGWRPLMWFAATIPWLHNDDHPSEDLARQVYRVSMPAALEAFVRDSVPGATRVEFCHAGARVVVHRGWAPLAEGCRAGEGDLVLALP